MQNQGQPQLAANLRLLCRRKASIAQVCRDLGINRQQFGKYLSGKLGASDRTLAALAAYFQVTPIDLAFSDLERARETETPGLPDEVCDAIRRNHADGSGVRLRDGLYHSLYAIREFPDHFLRSLVVVRRVGGATTFLRWFTLAPYQQNNFVALRTRGVVHQFGEDLSFIGRDEETNFLPSLTHMRAIDPHWQIFTGLALVHMPGKGSVAARTTMVRLHGNPTLASAMRSCGIRSLADGTLDETVLQTLRHGRKAIERFDPTATYLADVLRSLSGSTTSM